MYKRQYPKIVGETGGKDFIVAHKSANPKQVSTAITRGAFEFQGQKCSAASRGYISESLWDKVRGYLEDDLKSISMGSPENFENFVTSVIDEKSFDKISKYIDDANDSDSAEVIIGGSYDKSKGYFIEPTVILTSDPNLTVREVMDTEFSPLSIESDQIDIYNQFKTKDLFSAPVVDENNHLFGRITVDDIIQVAADEAEQDFIGFAQIEEDIFASPKKSIRNRLLWLSINLLTAIIAAFSISIFEDVIQQVVYDALLMPIVASMGGIAATQTLGIYIRAEAMRQLNRKNLRYLFRREFIVCLLYTSPSPRD